MLTKENFLQQYEKLDEEEIYQMYLSSNDYTTEAIEAINATIIKFGGLDEIKNRLFQKHMIEKEERRVLHETIKLFNPELEVEFLQKMIESNILSKDRKNELIESKYKHLCGQIEDRKIKPRTVFGSLIGGVIASIVGGLLWGFQMIQMHNRFIIFVFGLFLLCYGMIKLLTRQTTENRVVLIASILSTVVALIIGQVLFESLR